MDDDEDEDEDRRGMKSSFALAVTHNAGAITSTTSSIPCNAEILSSTFQKKGRKRIRKVKRNVPKKKENKMEEEIYRIEETISFFGRRCRRHHHCDDGSLSTFSLSLSLFSERHHQPRHYRNEKQLP